MISLNLPRELLNWAFKFKGSLSLPSLIVRCVFYVKENEIPLDELKPKERDRTNDRIRETNKTRKDKDISPM